MGDVPCHRFRVFGVWSCMAAFVLKLLVDSTRVRQHGFIQFARKCSVWVVSALFC